MASLKPNRVIPSDKPRICALDPSAVPPNLGSAYTAFDKLEFLTDDGHICAKYKNAGNIIVSNLHDSRDTKTFKNQASIVNWRLQFPLVITTHDNDTIQVIDITTGSCEKMTADGLPKDSYKKIQCILVNDDTIYCINPTTVFSWNWKNSRVTSNPRVIPLKDPDPNSRPLINIQQDFSSVIDASRLLLANGDVFQVWQVANDKEEMKILYEGRGSDQSKYFGVYYANNRVLTYNKNSFSVWNITRPAEASKNPIELAELMLITAVYMDDAFIVFGQSDGSVTLRDLSDGKLLYYVNDGGGATQGPTQTAHSLIDYNLEKKVNAIQKYGRWVFAAFENSRFAIFDITKEKGAPVFD